MACTTQFHQNLLDTDATFSAQANKIIAPVNWITFAAIISR
jgi:hypothetical protein